MQQLAGSGTVSTSSTTCAERSVWLVWRDGSPFETGTKTHGANRGIPFTHIIFTGGIQDAVLMSKDNSDGLWNRFLLAYADPEFQSLSESKCL
jgi:hypothetical protein